METSVGFVPVSELEPDVCARMFVCVASPHCHLGLTKLGLVAQLTFSSDITDIHVAEVRHDDPGLSKQMHSVGLIYQSNVETSADSSAQISLRQGSRVIHQTFVCCQSHRTNDRTLINPAAEIDRNLHVTPL